MWKRATPVPLPNFSGSTPPGIFDGPAWKRKAFSWWFSLDRKPNLRRSVHAVLDSTLTVLLYRKISPEHAWINKKTRLNGTGNGVKFSSDGNNTGRENNRSWERGWRVRYATFVKMITEPAIPESVRFADLNRIYMKVSWMILDKRPQKAKLRHTPGDLLDLSRNGNVDVAKETRKKSIQVTTRF